MNQNQILTKARKVLSENKEYQKAVQEYREIAKTLTHWGEPETVEQLIKIVGDEIVLSNEGSVGLTFDGYLELLFNLDNDFKKANLFVEPYDAGTFHIYYEAC